jgi:RHS repeat-associated protein
MTLMPHLAALRWDEDDRLRSTVRQAAGSGTPQTAYYVYDGGGQRVRKTTDRPASADQAPGRKSERIYLDHIEIYREYAADGTTITLERETLHVSDGDKPVALVETRTTGTDKAPAQLVRYQYGNHLGSAVLELDDQSDIISYEEYFPFGSTSYQAVAAQTGVPKRYRYTGKERDEENDLYYHGARYYAPWLGRWTSADPAGPHEALSLFVYVQNNPIRLTDPNGRWSMDWKAFGTGIVRTLGFAVLAVGVIGAVAATGGLAAGAIATWAGATITTAATVSEFVSGAILVGAALYGGIQTGKKAVSVVSGHDYDTGKPLTDRQRSYQAGSLLVDVAALAVSAAGIPAARARARIPGEMIDALTSARATRPDTGPGRGGRGNMTVSQTESVGARTPVKESIPGLKGTNVGHAEMRSKATSDASRQPGDRQIVAVDQVPCVRCDPALETGLPPGSIVVVPRAVGGPRPPRSIELNPSKISVKNWSEQAARGEIKVEPYTIIKTLKTFGQHFGDAPKGPLLLTPGAISSPPGEDPEKNKTYNQLRIRF